METTRDKAYVQVIWLLLLAGIVWRFSLLGPLAANRYSWLFSEGVRTFLAIGLFVFMARLPRAIIQSWSRPLMLLTLLGLSLMLMGGAHVTHGAGRWIKIGSQSIQPAEFAKIIVVVYLAGFLARHKNELTSFRRGILPAILILGMTFLLIVKQPDFGTSALLFAVGLWMLFVGGASLRHLLSLMLAAVPAGVYLVIVEPYRIERIRTWLFPGQDLLDSGYQVNQARWAIHDGGWWGQGLMEGHVRHGFLPESTNDFIAAVWIEEFGLVGLVLLILAYGWIVARLFSVARRAENAFDRFLAAGIGALFGSQVLFNLGVVTGLLPNKGIPLPLLSSGGSSMLASACLLGLGWRIMRSCESASATAQPDNVDSPSTVWNGL